jgi:hypothetical protein
MLKTLNSDEESGADLKAQNYVIDEWESACETPSIITTTNSLDLEEQI